MTRICTEHARSIGIFIVTVLCVLGTVSCIAKFDGAVDQEDITSAVSAQAAKDNELLIENDSPLPDTYPLADYELRFRARGGVVPLHWKVEKGTLPPGLKLESDGLLHGRPERAGEFQFTISVRDSGQAHAVQRGFVLRVVSALTVNWKKEAQVNGNRIEGSVDVSNTTPDDIDLTYIVLAVPSNGRAVAIGYQHFPLRRGTVDMELPFGEILPRGGYVVHVDVIGEVAAKNVIHRQRLQTQTALQVLTGP